MNGDTHTIQVNILFDIPLVALDHYNLWLILYLMYSLKYTIPHLLALLPMHVPHSYNFRAQLLRSHLGSLMLTIVTQVRMKYLHSLQPYDGEFRNEMPNILHIHTAFCLIHT